MLEIKGERGQVAIFVILAIVIVAAVFLIFWLTPARNIFTDAQPTIRLEECVMPTLEEGIDKTSLQGGGIDPENYYLYQGEKIEYLCFTNQYYETCGMQRPLLKQYVEDELYDYVEPTARGCLDDVRDDLERRGWDVSGSRDIDLRIEPGSIDIIMSGFSMTREDTGEMYDEFVVSKRTDLYNLLMISTSILNWEARYGDSEIVSYMMYYPDMRIGKEKQPDGTTIYEVSSRDTGREFVFATRSLAWPPGYDLEEAIYVPRREIENEE